MIEFKKLEFSNEDRCYSCNSCHQTPNILYTLMVRFNNSGGQQVMLCKECAKDLRQKIKFNNVKDKSA